MRTQNKTFLRWITVLLICALCFGTACSWGGSEEPTPTATPTPKPTATLLPTSAVKVGDIMTFGSYEQDNDTNNGKETIQWRVLEVQDGKVLLISEKALDCQQYNKSYTSVTWETCTLRQWLNGTFLNNAFSADEQAKIVTTHVSADKNPEFGTYPDNATNDKVFLLSITEVEKYFTANVSRRCAPTTYAETQGAWTSSYDQTASGEAACFWWLRSPGDGQGRAASVNYGGSVDVSGHFVISDYDCVRPAMWVTLD